ncbi:hypothetical protein D3C84_309360 [compost metagenome]
MALKPPGAAGAIIACHCSKVRSGDVQCPRVPDTANTPPPGTSIEVGIGIIANTTTTAASTPSTEVIGDSGCTYNKNSAGSGVIYSARSCSPCTACCIPAGATTAAANGKCTTGCCSSRATIGIVRATEVTDTTRTTCWGGASTAHITRIGVVSAPPTASAAATDNTGISSDTDAGRTSRSADTCRAAVV